MDRINYKFSKLDAIKLFFSKDKEEFPWKHVTDQEKILLNKDIFELAAIIANGKNSNMPGETYEAIVAEHLLDVRLAKIQAKASVFSGLISLIGAIAGATIGVLLAK